MSHIEQNKSTNEKPVRATRSAPQRHQVFVRRDEARTAARNLKEARTGDRSRGWLHKGCVTSGPLCLSRHWPVGYSGRRTCSQQYIGSTGKVRPRPGFSDIPKIHSILDVMFSASHVFDIYSLHVFANWPSSRPDMLRKSMAASGIRPVCFRIRTLLSDSPRRELPENQSFLLLPLVSSMYPPSFPSANTVS